MKELLYLEQFKSFNYKMYIFFKTKKDFMSILVTRKKIPSILLIESIFKLIYYADILCP